MVDGRRAAMGPRTESRNSKLTNVNHEGAAAMNINTDTAPIGAEEFRIIGTAMRALLRGIEPEERESLAARWRSMVPANHGERLVDTFVLVYPTLDERGKIDSWGRGDCKLILTDLVMFFPSEDQRWRAVYQAMTALSSIKTHDDFAKYAQGL